jgi:hypothetical protein
MEVIEPAEFRTAHALLPSHAIGFTPRGFHSPPPIVIIIGPRVRHYLQQVILHRVS